jgi:AraC family ethanolamine operon transcriptional activator
MMCATATSIDPNPKAGHGRGMISEFSSDDCDELSESLAHTEQVFRQLKSGPFVGKWRLMELPGVSIVKDELSHGIYNSAAVAKGFLIAFIPIRQRGHLFLNGHTYDKPCLFMGQPETRTILSVPSDFMSYTIEFELQALSRTSEAMGLPISSDWNCIPDTNAASAASRLVEQAFCSAAVCNGRSPQEKADGLITGWLNLMRQVSGQTQIHDRSTLSKRRCATLDAADFMLDNLGNDLSLADLCKAAYVTERTLRNGFQEMFGISPKRWLKRERLSAVRKDLKTADAKASQVREIAVKHGFTQFAHFATDYRKQFGESPSQTLRR